MFEESKVGYHSHAAIKEKVMTENASGQSLGHVLIVDDNEMNREVLSRRLERQGYTFGVAEDGVQALELMRAQRFDVVLLDIMMPRMNGYQVLEAMNGDPVLRELPVIVVSAVSELDSIVRCVELGAEDYLFKPFNPVLLKARLTACLEKKRLRDQQRQGQAVARFSLSSSLASIKSNVDQLMSSGLTGEQRQITDQIHRIVDELMKSVSNS
jgi:CheY-like chemotaxis protein